MGKIKGVLAVQFEFDEDDWRLAYTMGPDQNVREDIMRHLTGNGDGVTEYLTELFANDSGAQATSATLVWENVHTRTEVSKAMNNAANRVQEEAEYEDSSSIRMQDGVNLTVNLALGWLDDPEHSAEQIITESYDVDYDYLDDDEVPEDEENDEELDDEQRQARKDAYTVRKVLSWVA